MSNRVNRRVRVGWAPLVLCGLMLPADIVEAQPTPGPIVRLGDAETCSVAEPTVLQLVGDNGIGKEAWFWRNGDTVGRAELFAGAAGAAVLDSRYAPLEGPAPRGDAQESVGWIVWGTDTGLEARRVSPVLGQDALAKAELEIDRSVPAADLAVSPSGSETLVVWVEEPEDADRPAPIFATVLGPQGEELAARREVGTILDTFEPADVSVTALRAGAPFDYVVTWLSVVDDERAIVARRVKIESFPPAPGFGRAIGFGEIERVSTPGTFFSPSPGGPPEIAALPAGGHVIAWKGRTESDPPFSEVYVRVFGPNGFRGQQLSVARQLRPIVAGRPGLAVDASGRIAVTWEASFPQLPVVPAQPYLPVAAALLDSQGTILEEPFLVSEADDRFHEASAASFAPDGTLLVSWAEVPVEDTSPFAVCGPPGHHVAGRRFGTDCTGEELCLLDQRFAVRVKWSDPFNGGSGVGESRVLTGDTGAFWFFDEDNLELMVKVLDGRAVNGHFWVFFGSLTNVEFELTVTDRRTGDSVTYVNPPFTFASRGDTTAFPDGTPSVAAAGRLP